MQKLCAIVGAIAMIFLVSGLGVLHAQMMEKEMGDIHDSLPHDPAECALNGIANGGFDLVSYRQPGGPRHGDEAISAEYEGLTYLFESTANRDEFNSNPERYLPAYSGWCAVTLALGRLICPDYTNFKIENDQLLLFELTGFTNGQTLWNSDALRFRRQANDNYSIVIDFE